MSWELAYSPELVRRTLQSFAEQLPQYYRDARERPSPVSPPDPPHEVIALATEELLRGKTPEDVKTLAARIADLTRIFFANAQRLHSPRYIGHQVPAVVPVAGLFDALAKVTNQGLAAFEMGPFCMAAERALVRYLGGMIGYDMDQSDGIATSGGSLANLTGVLAARQYRYPDVWKKGLDGPANRVPYERGRPAILCSADTHYSIARAAGIVGIGTDNVLKVPVDADRRMRGATLDAALVKAFADGYDPFCVVASACSTATGAFDFVEEIADVCDNRGVWLHVDGAHGASLLFSRKYKSRVGDLSKADTIVWDAHKMLFVPSLSTFLFYKHAATSFLVFDQDAPYIWDKEVQETKAIDAGLRTVECTKGGISLGLWGLIASCGPTLLEELVDRSCDVTAEFHGMLEEAPDFEPLHVPQCNILCFRHVPESLRNAAPAVVSAFQKKLRAALLAKRSFYITGTSLDGLDCLRVTVINPATGPAELGALMGELRALGRTLL